MKQPSVVFEDTIAEESDLRTDVLNGLAQTPKRIPPKHFYDRRGSELFDRICTLPEYYLTRTELGILESRAGEIARRIGPGAVLIELGSGASRKVRLLLQALRPAAYVGVDISREFLLASTRKLAADHPGLRVQAVCADLCAPLPEVRMPAGRRIAFYPGSSIGNFDPADAHALLARVRELVGDEGGLLIGVDLKKDPEVLHAAYNDAQGVTAEFNLNLLRRLRRELNAQIDLEGFNHQAYYNQDEGRVEMHLASRRRQTLRIDGQRFELDAGETIHTENSYKYTLTDFTAIANQSGFTPEQTWTDAKNLFAVILLRAE